MVKHLLTSAAIVIVTAAGAHAAESTGTVRSVNTKTDAITLSDGMTYTLPERIEAESLQVGEKVKITYSSSKGHNKASSVAKVR